MIVHDEPDFLLLGGDVRDELDSLPAGSVDCIVTSPPYFSLRDYRLPASTWADGWKGQLGLEPDPMMYVAHLVEVFQHVRRVLAPHGTVWLNLGDSYARDRKKGQHKPGDSGKQAYVYDRGGGRASVALNLDELGVKPKDLMLIPAEVALALRRDGWFLRAEIPWDKPNAMPASVTDRPTRTHEMIYMLTASHRYWYDQEAVREPVKAGNSGSAAVVELAGGTVFEENGKPKGARRNYAEVKGANCRSVWTIPTQSFTARSLGIDDDDHFAPFPEELPRRAIEAGCPREVCEGCGEPRRRLVERSSISRDELPTEHSESRPRRYDAGKAGDPQGPGAGQRFTVVRDLGWSTCSCPSPTYRRGVVLDPFLGSGTTAVVARRLGRLAIGIELSESYHRIALARYAQWWKTPFSRPVVVEDDQLALIP